MKTPKSKVKTSMNLLPNRPFFSIVMTSYNNCKTIDEAITALLNQNFSSYELILVSDGCTDGTKEIMKTYASKYPKIKFISLDYNFGQSFAKDIAILEAQGEYIAIADADDIWVANKLRMQYQHLSAHPEIDVLGGQMIRFGSWGRAVEPTHNPTLSHEISKKLRHKRNPMNHPTVVFRKTGFLSVGGYRTDFKRNADLDLFIRMNKKGMKFANLKSILVMYRTSSPIQNFKYWVSVEIHRQEIILANSHILLRLFPLIRYPSIILAFMRLTIVFLIMKRKTLYVD
jgi:glycosyltransferase involved in cell wall biosynthesis